MDVVVIRIVHGLCKGELKLVIAKLGMRRAQNQLLGFRVGEYIRKVAGIGNAIDGKGVDGVQHSSPVFGEGAGTGGDAVVIRIIFYHCGLTLQDQIPDLQEAGRILAVDVMITVGIRHGQRIVDTQTIDIQCGRVRRIDPNRACTIHSIDRYTAESHGIGVMFQPIDTQGGQASRIDPTNTCGFGGIDRHAVDLHGICAMLQIIHPDNRHLINSLVAFNADIIVFHDNGNALYQFSFGIKHIQIDHAVIRSHAAADQLESGSCEPKLCRNVGIQNLDDMRTRATIGGSAVIRAIVAILNGLIRRLTDGFAATVSGISIGGFAVTVAVIGDGREIILVVDHISRQDGDLLIHLYLSIDVNRANGLGSSAFIDTNRDINTVCPCHKLIGLIL